MKAWCYIPVNKGYKAKVDQEDFARVSKYTWRILKKPTGRIRVMTSFRTKDGPQQMSLGQLIMKNPKNKMVYARRYQDELDFRKSNLVVCSMSERQRMLPKSTAAGSSQFKGVSYFKKLKKWRANIEVGGSQLHLGVFRTEVDAARAYNKAARKHFGEMAYQNRVSGRKASRRKAA